MRIVESLDWAYLRLVWHCYFLAYVTEIVIIFNWNFCSDSIGYLWTVKRVHLCNLFQHFPTFHSYALSGRFMLQSLVNFGGRYIYNDSHDKTEYNRICSQQMDRTMRRFINQLLASLIAYNFILIGPLRAYFVDGIRSTLIATRIPFTEPKSNAEFFGNFSLQSIVLTHSFTQYIGVEVFLALLENAVNITPRLVVMELEHTIQLYKNKSITALELRSRIVNIVKQSNDSDE